MAKSIVRAGSYTPTRGRHKGETFASWRQYRNQLAQDKGYRNLAGEQRAARPVRTARDLEMLQPRQREARDRALEAVALLRRGQATSLTNAARRAHTTRNVVEKYAPSALTPDTRGRLQAKPRDTLYRPMKFLTPKGQIVLPVRDSRAASTIGEYWDAVQYYLDTQDDRKLRPFLGKSIRVDKQGYPFVTDRSTIDYLARVGELRFESIYDLAA